MGTSLVIQWLRLHASTARGTGVIPGQGTKIPHAMLHSSPLTPPEKKTDNKLERLAQY